jgi:hypothetical protein
MEVVLAPKASVNFPHGVITQQILGFIINYKIRIGRKMYKNFKTDC